MEDGIYHTLNLDVAPKLGDRVDWNNKILLQLSSKELTLLAGVAVKKPKLKGDKPLTAKKKISTSK